MTTDAEYAIIGREEERRKLRTYKDISDKETSKVVQLIIRTRGIELHSYHNTKIPSRALAR